MRDQPRPQSRQKSPAEPTFDDAIAARRVFVVTDDHNMAEELRVQLSNYGYDVVVFGSLADLRHAIQPGVDILVLMDINHPEDNSREMSVMKEIQQGRETPIPVIFFSADDSIKARLDAARAGGIAYLSKPVNISDLIDKLDAMAFAEAHEPYRVMIVDDSEALNSYHTAILEQAGMSVKAVTDPLTVIEMLFEFTPDLILIDIYMPECNGLELAKVIRQFDAFISIPIVFLSMENNLDTQLFAMGMGGDDFLTKPIQPEHLISSVTNRIRRSLTLRSLMVRDSLTGLLNHTAIKDQLKSEVARTIRQKKPLSFAMIDIDYFKQVNDTYGHPVGDRVIKSLSRVLKQRLRASDLIGRYGGEEFAVVLVDAAGDAAQKVMDTIRNNFEQLSHVSEDNEFSVTFSCGIAEVAQFPDAIRLSDAADKALYKAKRAGRNQVALMDGASAG